MITKNTFGTTPDGRAITEYTITNGCGNSVSVLDYGATVRAIRVFGRDVCLGYDTAEEYAAHGGYLGAVIGRFANRIGGGRFVIDGRLYTLACNEGSNHLHGGEVGFDRQMWAARIDGDALTLSLLSADGDEGYPGNLHAFVTYTFGDDNALRITYAAFSDEDTIFSPTSHIYFNLNGHASGSAMGHTLRIGADEFTPTDAHQIPTGERRAVEGTPFDFRKACAVGARIDEDDEQLRIGGGYDHNFVLRAGADAAAELTGEGSGIGMEVQTDRPGLQLYTANFLTPRAGKGGAQYAERGAVCLETQGFPNAPAIATFPSPILRAGERFASTTVYRFYRGEK